MADVPPPIPRNIGFQLAFAFPRSARNARSFGRSARAARFPTASKSCWSNRTTFRNLPASFISAAAMPPRHRARTRGNHRRTSCAPAPRNAPAARSRKTCAAWAPIWALAPAPIPARFPSAGLTEFSGELLELVADLARNASFPAEEFERERRQMLEGLRIERTTPSFLASERLRRVLFGAHPYAVVSPTEAQVEAYQRDQLLEFYRTHYEPAEALLVLVGDFSAQKMLAEIERIFGSWEPVAVIPPPNPPLPELRGRHVHLVHLPEAVQAQVRSAIAPSRASIRTGCASASPTRSTAARSIRAW